MRAGGYMQRMFGDPKFVDMLNPVMQKAFGVPNFSDLQTVIDKYMESNPSQKPRFSNSDLLALRLSLLDNESINIK